MMDVRYSEELRAVKEAFKAGNRGDILLLPRGFSVGNKKAAGALSAAACGRWYYAGLVADQLEGDHWKPFQQAVQACYPNTRADILYEIRRLAAGIGALNQFAVWLHCHNTVVQFRDRPGDISYDVAVADRCVVRHLKDTRLLTTVTDPAVLDAFLLGALLCGHAWLLWYYVEHGVSFGTLDALELSKESLAQFVEDRRADLRALLQRWVPCTS